MYENEDKTCSQFFITTAEKVLYLYEIAVEEEKTDKNTSVVKLNVGKVLKQKTENKD